MPFYKYTVEVTDLTSKIALEKFISNCSFMSLWGIENCESPQKVTTSLEIKTEPSAQKSKPGIPLQINQEYIVVTDPCCCMEPKKSKKHSNCLDCGKEILVKLY